MRIKQIDIKAFRGIPQQITINIPLKNNRPTSLLILGDNGVGKSSIVDAIEFGLQGHISQTKLFSTPSSPSIISYKSSALPTIKIMLENNEILIREVINDEQGLLTSLRDPHKLFNISPFVLRRHDILRFINSSEAERTLVFSNYLREENINEWNEHPIDELKRLQDERLVPKILKRTFN